MRTSQAPARSSRLAGAAGALLLQGGFLLLFLASMPVIRPPAPLERELAIIMPRLQPAPPLPAATGEATGPPRVAPLLPASPAPLFSAPALPPALPGLQGFGQALNNCAPEKYSSLLPDQQVHCPRPGAGMAIEELPNLMGTPSQVKDNARWANALAHEKSPLLLPGANQDGFGIHAGIDTDGKGTGFLAEGALNAQNFPVYDVKQYAPEDFYKIEQDYDAWHKAHPDPASAKPSG